VSTGTLIRVAPGVLMARRKDAKAKTHAENNEAPWLVQGEAVVL
jgi:hypothetical protein